MSCASCMLRHMASMHGESLHATSAVADWQVTLEGGAGQENTVVRIQGLTPEGYLLAADAGGQRYSLSPDGNSLDFFKGLIKTKLPR